MRRILAVAIVCTLAGLPAMGLQASSWYVPNALTIPELPARPVIDGTAGASEWTGASTMLNLSDYTGGGIPPADTSDFAGAFQMGTYQGDLYFVVYESDNTPNFNARNHTADSCEFRINLTGTLVDVNDGTENPTNDQNQRPAAPAGKEFANHGECFLKLGCGQVRGRGDGQLLVVGTEGDASVAINTTGSGSPVSPAMAAVLDYAVGTVPASVGAPLANGRLFEFEIKVSAMNITVAEPFGFGVAVNDSDADGVRAYQAAWHGGPQQALGTTNPGVDTAWNTNVGAIQPWRRMFVRAATFADISVGCHPAISSNLASGSGGGGGYKILYSENDIDDGTPFGAQGTAQADADHIAQWVTMLESAGHTVTLISSAGLVAAVNAATDMSAFDLIIIGRDFNSGTFTNAKAALAAISIPILSTQGKPFQADRAGWWEHSLWDDGDNNNDYTCKVEIPTHPIFNGLAVPGDGIMHFTEFINSDCIEGTLGATNSATVIATVAARGAEVTGVGAPYIAYWAAGTPYYTGGETPQSKRMVLTAGGGVDDIEIPASATDITDEKDGIFDLTRGGAQVFMNAVEYMVSGTVPAGGVSYTYTLPRATPPGGGDGGGPDYSAGGEGEGEPQGNSIVANVYPPYIDEGTLVILTAPAGSGYVWKKDGAVVPGQTERDLVFSPITLADAGTYIAEYDDGLKAAQTTAPFVLTVQSAGSVPAASLLGLLALAGACGLGGSRIIRRRKR